ncbi:hypothetical protein H4R35_003506 [Dimargaris xerosporica]|nr:hypothetical protein H4R35_003506 [Dimargaris xerosporica]
MADNYQALLETRLFHEQRPVSFLWLSRTLAIHVNKAKCLLYEFHQQQNQKSGTHCEAIYCVSGTPLKAPKASQPAASSDHDTPPALAPGLAHAFVLTTEEALSATKALFQAVTSVHIWGLQAKVPQDPAVLYAAALDERADYEAADLADEIQQRNQVSAVINAHVQVSGRGESLQNRMLVVQKSHQEETKPTPKGEIPLKKEPSTMPVESASPKSTAQATKPAAKQPTQATISRTPARPKATRQSQAVATKQSASPEPTSIANADSSAKKTDAYMKVDKSSNGDNGEDKEEEEADDNDGEEAIQMQRRRPKLTKRSRVAIQDESEDDDSSAQAAEEQSPSLSAAAEATTSAVPATAKPRKRRKVKKTHTYQDEQGYLVTEEKDDWETCSEADEPVAPPTKPPPGAPPK